MFYAGMSTQEHDLQRKREVGGGRGRGLKRDRDGESYGERSEKEWHSVEKWIDEEQID